MVNDKMREDILSFGIPVVMMGDCNQLPPVFGASSILDFPDFTLTKIMRQAEGDPIVYLSQCILHDIPIEYGTYGRSKVVESVPIDQHVISDYDMLICAKNKTRDALNKDILYNVFHRDNEVPFIGAKMICRKNDWDESIDGIYLTNGLVGYVTDINLSSLYRDILYMSFQPDFMDRSFEKLSVNYKFLTALPEEKQDFGFDDLDRFEYAYAITTHLSQGSEYPRVLFMDEKFQNREMQKRLRYTAITRAKDMVTYVKMPEAKSVFMQFNTLPSFYTA